ncbi:hypothetical protein BH23VER1_BH23VER1_09280 [soil metagenome]
MSESERYRFTYIPLEIGGPKELVRIPRSFEADGLFMAGAETLADAWYQKEPEKTAKGGDSRLFGC